MGVLLKLGIVLVAGLIGGRLARMVKLPEVTGYLLSGLFLGPSLFNLISAADSASFSVISDVALAAIAIANLVLVVLLWGTMKATPIAQQ